MYIFDPNECVNKENTLYVCNGQKKIYDNMYTMYMYKYKL